MAGNNAQTVRTRKDALKMANWDPPLLWYAKAVGAMKQRPVKDPTSWAYQAGVHGFDLNVPINGSQPWQVVTHNQPLPSGADQTKYWRQCQHGSWYFLPWHRMYLGYFERMVAQTVADLGGPADWALPYWNYNAGPASRKLPAAFTDPKLPDGSANPLLEPNRDNGNNGQPFLGAGGLNPKPAFKEMQFAAGPGASGFGGPVTVFRHSGGAFGTLENQPHNHVHVDIGGLMSDPDTAALDPIFWLHHANIDRLWEAWLKANVQHRNPTDSRWLSFKFDLHDVTGQGVSLRPADVLNATLAPFYYQYDDTSVPAGAAVKKAGAAGLVPGATAIMEQQPMPEMVGASTQAAKLARDPKTLAVRLFPVSGPHLRKLGAAGTQFRKAYLHVENVRGEGPPASYDIYLNVPEGAGEPPEQFYVGTAATFGLRSASVGSQRHAGSGLHFTFDVTDVVNALKSESQWNPETLRVTFIPSRKPPTGSAIEVGRVSLYYQ